MRSTRQIDPEVVAGIKPLGFTLEWKTTEVYGQPQTEHMAHMYRNGWAPVKKSDFNGKLRRYCAGLPDNRDRKGRVAAHGSA